MHIYETADWWGSAGANPNWSEDEYQTVFLDLMEQHRDKILFEATGHNHLAGMRYHSLQNSKD